MPATAATSGPVRVDAGTEQLDVTVHGGIATVVLNNQERRNALSRAMVRALPEVLRRLARDPGVRVVVLRGAGGRAFAAGVDITDFADTDGRSVLATFQAEYTAMLDQVRGYDRATIAMIEGACVGGGVELALACDLRFAAEGSRFAIPAARLGLGYVEVEPLVAAIGAARAAEMLFTARSFDVAELATSGMVNQVVPPEQLAASSRRPRRRSRATRRSRSRPRNSPCAPRRAPEPCATIRPSARRSRRATPRGTSPRASGRSWRSGRRSSPAGEPLRPAVTARPGAGPGER